MAEKKNNASANDREERGSAQDIGGAPDVEERARFIARSLSQTFPPDRRQNRELFERQKWLEMLSSLECDVKLRALPDYKLRLWSDWCYNDWSSLEYDAWKKLEAMSVASALHWTKRGDWDALADYIERGDEVTPEIRSFITKILRGEITKPGKPATLTKLRRNFEIVKWIGAERAGGKSKTAALESAAAKFNLAYDTIDDIFDAALTSYRRHVVTQKDMLTPAVLAFRALRVIAQEFRRRGSDECSWVFKESLFDGVFGELEEHLEQGGITPDIITP
jgi:hypothetical protein